MQRDVYMAIMKAADLGAGLRLSADECWALSHDDAIVTRASNGLEENELGIVWGKIDPAKRRAPPDPRAGSKRLPIEDTCMAARADVVAEANKR